MDPITKNKYVYVGERAYIDGYLHHWVRSETPHYRINYTESRRKSKDKKYKNCYILPSCFGNRK